MRWRRGEREKIFSVRLCASVSLCFKVSVIALRLSGLAFWFTTDYTDSHRVYFRLVV